MPKYIPLPAKGPLTKPNQTKPDPNACNAIAAHRAQHNALWSGCPAKRNPTSPKGKVKRRGGRPKGALHQAMQWQCRVAAALPRQCTHPNTAAHALPFSVSLSPSHRERKIEREREEGMKKALK